MKKIFDRKLYFEGLKRVRLIGIIFGSILLLLSACIPLEYMLTDPELEEIVDYDNFAWPLFPMMFFTPFFFTSAFSFLNKRKACDFYHAIPHTRICLYISFTAAALTWIAGLITATSLLTGLLWTVFPQVSYDIGLIPLTIIVHLLGCIYVGGFTVLAISLTGTRASNFVVACVLMFSARIFGGLCIQAIQSFTPTFDLNYSILSIFSTRSWLPAAVIRAYTSFYTFKQPLLWILSGVVIVGCYVLGGWVFKNRCSEMAGKDAPGKVMKCIFRCLCSLPFALYATFLMILDGESLFAIITGLTSLLVFFLYELIASKKVKTALKTMPLFLAVIAVCGLFSGCIYGTESAVCSGSYTAEEMRSVALYSIADVNTTYDVKQDMLYEPLILQEVSIDDQRAKEIISQALAETIRYEQNDNYFPYPDEDFEYGYQRYLRHGIKIELQSGKTIYRKLLIPPQLYAEFINILKNSEGIFDTYIDLPPKETVVSLYLRCNADFSAEETELLYESFQREYALLTPEEKMEYKTNNENYTSTASNPRNCAFVIRGKLENGTYYAANYNVFSKFKETVKLYQAMLNNSPEDILKLLEEITSMEYSDFRYARKLKNEKYAHLTFYDDTLTGMFQYDWSYEEWNFENRREGLLQKYENLQELATLLLANLSVEKTSNLRLEIKYVSTTQKEMAYFWLKDMSKEDEERIYQLLKELNTGFESNHPS